MIPRTLQKTLRIIEEIRQLSFRFTALSARIEANQKKIKDLSKKIESVHEMENKYLTQSKSLDQKLDHLKSITHKP